MKTNNKCFESILDAPKDTLCPKVWNISENPPLLTIEAQQKIDSLVQWVQNKYRFNDLSVFIIGSICSNSYSEDSDIDIDFCAKDYIKDDSPDSVVKEFGWKFKKDVIDNYFSRNDNLSKIGSHPIEVYFEPNPFQCFMSIGCYNVLESKWEVGPDAIEKEFDPIAGYYANAMKQAQHILEDIRNKIFEIYEDAFACKASKDESFKKKMQKQIIEKLKHASNLYDTMKVVRSNFQKPAKSKEEALKRRSNKKRHIVDAAFKFLDKFGYISILKDFIDILYDENLEIDSICDKILSTVSQNMQLQHLQDSENENDKKLLNMLKEAKPLDEDAKDLAKMSFIAGLMAISSFLPATALAKNLSKATKQDQHLTIGSPLTKKAIAQSAKNNEMIGQMSKTNVVNLIAQVLWKEGRGEGDVGLNAIASVILNRTGNNPQYIIDVIKQKRAFSCMKKYKGGWTDKTYTWFLPFVEIAGNANNKAIWDKCNQIALDLIDKKFKSTIGNRNAYLNKKTASADAVNTWGKKCDLKIGSHHFGYLKAHDPKYVVPGTFTSWKKHNSQSQNNKKIVIVKAGQTLGKIAKENNTTIAKILELNKDIKNPNAISVGQKIKIA